jgi:hypothetical protein
MDLYHSVIEQKKALHCLYYRMKNPYVVPLSQVGRSLVLNNLTIEDVLEDDEKDVSGCCAKVAENVLQENNDLARKVVKRFVSRYGKNLRSFMINERNELKTPFPEDIMRIAENLTKLTKDIKEIDSASWRDQDSVFGQVCTLEGVSKRNQGKRHGFYNLWVNKTGKLRACFELLVKRGKSLPTDAECNLSSVSSDDSDAEPNARQTHPVGFVKCAIPVGTRVIESALGDMMFSSKEAFNLIVKDLISTCSRGCVVNLNRVNLNKNPNPLFTGYAYCAHDECRKFRFTISDRPTDNSPAKLCVYSDKTSTKHAGMLARTLKGLERKMVRAELEDENPYVYRLKCAEDCDVDLAYKGDLQKVRTPAVFRKVRSEALARNDMHKDDLIDLIMMKREDDGQYIQAVGSPFHAYLWSEKMQKIALSTAKRTSPKGEYTSVLYFDATGSVVRKQEGKPVFLYSGSFDVRGDIYPAFDFLLNNHCTEDISQALIAYRKSVKLAIGRWPLFNRVVVDDSLALKSAISEAWNNMSLKDYINAAYEWLKKGSAPENMSVILGCGSHFNKRVCAGASKFAEKGSTQRKFFIEAFLAVAQVQEFNVMTRAYGNLAIILNSETRTPLLRKAIQDFQSTTKFTIFKEEDYETDVNYDEDPLADLWAGSPLARHLNDKASEKILLVTKEPKTAEVNTLHSPKWFQYMNKTFMPKLIFQSAILLPPGEMSISNQMAENENRIVKVILLKNKRKLKPGRLIKKLKQRVLGLTKLHDLRIGKKPKSLRKGTEIYKESFKKILRNKTCHKSLKAVKRIDLDKITPRAVKKQTKRKMATGSGPPSPKKTRAKSSKNQSNWKFNLTSDEDTVASPTLHAGKDDRLCVQDLLDECPTTDFPPHWSQVEKYFPMSEVTHGTLRPIVENGLLTDDAINTFAMTKYDNSNFFFLYSNTALFGYIDEGLSWATKKFVEEMCPAIYAVWLVPVNVDRIHWALFVVLPYIKTVLLVDSLNTKAENVTRLLVKTLQCAMEQSELDVTLDNWILFRCDDVVQQGNGIDCGVFVCLFMESIFSEKELILKKDDGAIARKWLAWKLCDATIADTHHKVKLNNLRDTVEENFPPPQILVVQGRPIMEIPTSKLLSIVKAISQDENFRKKFNNPNIPSFYEL